MIACWSQVWRPSNLPTLEAVLPTPFAMRQDQVVFVRNISCQTERQENVGLVSQNKSLSRECFEKILKKNLLLGRNVRYVFHTN